MSLRFLAIWSQMTRTNEFIFLYLIVNGTLGCYSVTRPVAAENNAH